MRPARLRQIQLVVGSFRQLQGRGPAALASGASADYEGLGVYDGLAVYDGSADYNGSAERMMTGRRIICNMYI